MESQQNIEEKILLCAEELFLEKGFSMTSTTHIAQKAGCNQAMVHYYFRTKEKLFERIFEEKLKLFSGTFFAFIGRTDLTFKNKIELMTQAHFDILSKNRKLPFFILNELVLNPQRIKVFKDKLKHIPIEIITYIETELKAEIAARRIRDISMIDLIINIVSLNAAAFISIPILNNVMQFSQEEIEERIKIRRSENVIAVLKSLETQK